MPKKLYEVLEVPEDASTSAIQQAYREKVKESHPDLSDDPDAGDQFQLVLQAKEVLTDPEERELYDDLGHKTYMDMFGDDDADDGASESASGRSTTARSSGDETTRSDASGGASGDASAGSSASGGGAGGSSNGGASASSTASSASGSSSGDTSSRDTSSSGGRSTGTSSSSSGTGGSSSPSESDTAGGSEPGGSGGGGSTGPSDATGGPSTRGAGGGVSERTVAQEAERSRKEWQAAGRSGDTGSSDGPWSTASAQGEHLSAERVEEGIATKIRSQDALEMTVVMLVVYPIFVFASVWPGFSTLVNVVVGVVTVGVVVYTLTEPIVSVVVFGAWSVLTPLLVLFAGEQLLDPASLFALTVTWVPFMLGLLLTLAMPDG